MQPQCDPRARKRFPCTLSLDESQHTGMILNVSQRGVFIQTSLPASPGTLIDFDFRDPRDDQPIAQKAAVVWRKRVSSRLTGTTNSGMGLRIIEPTRAWSHMVAHVLGGSVEAKDRGAQPAADDEDGAGATRVELTRYLVRLACDGGPRSRSIVIECAAESEVAAEAARQAGEGWSVLEIREAPTTRCRDER